MLNDQQRAAIGLFLGNLLSFVVLVGIVTITVDGIAALNAVISSGLLVVGLLLPSKTQADAKATIAKLEAEIALLKAA